MMTSEINKSVRKTAVYLVEGIMEIKKCSRDEAVELLMETSVYHALMDADTDLYLESRESVLDRLKGELAGNPDQLLVL